ncbi:MAG: TPM domain-containing protein, partial [Acidobacteriota bacterium]
SGHEVALVTVPDLGGWSLETLSLEIARKWGLGQKDRHDGALLLVARKEHKVRIEVGRGLEGKLTDSICGRIIRGIIAPEFRGGRFYEGLRAGIEAIHAAAGGDYGRIPPQPGRRGSRTLGLFPLLFFAFLMISLLRRGGGRAGSLWPWLLLGGMSSMGGHRPHGSGFHGGFGGGGFGGFGGGGGFSGGGASGGW